MNSLPAFAPDSRARDLVVGAKRKSGRPLQHPATVCQDLGTPATNPSFAGKLAPSLTFPPRPSRTSWRSLFLSGISWGEATRRMLKMRVIV